MARTAITIGLALDGGASGCGCGDDTSASGGCCDGTEAAACACTGEAAASAQTDAPAECAAGVLQRTLRTSSYVIYVDLPHNDQDLLLVHGYTRTSDKVSKRVGTFVRALQDRRAPKPLYGDRRPDPEIESFPELSDELITVLRKRGYLTYLTREEDLNRFTGIADDLHSRTTQPGYVTSSHTRPPSIRVTARPQARRPSPAGSLIKPSMSFGRGSR